MSNMAYFFVTQEDFAWNAARQWPRDSALQWSRQAAYVRLSGVSLLANWVADPMEFRLGVRRRLCLGHPPNGFVIFLLAPSPHSLHHHHNSRVNLPWRTHQSSQIAHFHRLPAASTHLETNRRLKSSRATHATSTPSRPGTRQQGGHPSARKVPQAVSLIRPFRHLRRTAAQSTPPYFNYLTRFIKRCGPWTTPPLASASLCFSLQLSLPTTARYTSPPTMPSLRLIPFTLALWVATAAAADSNNNTLPAIMGRFAPCVMLCYHAAAVDSECSVGDFKCVCSNPGSLVVKMGLCVGKACDDVPQCLGSKPDGSKPCGEWPSSRIRNNPWRGEVVLILMISQS